MLLHCPGKKCNTNQEQKLNVKTDLVVCTVCGESNITITSFMKSMMKSAGDVYKEVVIKKAFMYKCLKCNEDREVNIKDDVAYCRACSTRMNLAGPTLKAIVNNTRQEHSAKIAAEQPAASSEPKKKGVVRRSKKVESGAVVVSDEVEVESDTEDKAKE